MNKKAFTLIELLVVISIIALLLAILMPALNMVKKKATSAVCLSNLGQMSKAWYMYAGENNDGIVGGQTANLDPYEIWSPGTPCFAWVCFPQTDTGTSVTSGNSEVEEKINGIKKGLLYPYLENPKVYHCPGDQRSKKPPVKGGTGKGGYRTYSISGGMNGVDPNGGKSSWGIVPCTRLSQVKRPSEKYVFIEEMDGRGANAGAWIVRAKEVATQWVDPIGIWHGDSSTLGYADGHAKLRKWKDASTVKMAQEQTFYLTPPQGEGEDLEFMQKGYAYRSLSGESW